MIHSLANRVSTFNRLRKYALFMEIFRPTSRTTILDVGASDSDHSESTNLLEKKYPHPENITVLGLDPYVVLKQRHPRVKTVTYDGRRFPFPDKSFDLCWSNAVLEHVGGPERQREFLSEILRVSRAAFVTTPNRYFPFEAHTKVFLLHYLPKPVFDKLLPMLGKGFAAGDYMHLLSRREYKRLALDCGLPRAEIVSNRLLGLPLDFVLVVRDRSADHT